MTFNNTTKLHQPSTMADQLDLDSLLLRHNAVADSTSSSSSGDDDDDRRRIDALLDNSDHSSSSSDHDNDVVSLRANFRTLSSTSTSITGNSTQLKYNLIQRFKSDEYAGYTSRKPVNSRPVSVFGSGYRAAGKPGAALAAAAAASRSVKSRRAMSLSLVGKVSDGVDGLSEVSDRIKSVDDGLTSNDVGNGGTAVSDVCESVVDSEGSALLNSEVSRSNSFVERVDEEVSRSELLVEIGNEVEKSGIETLSLALDDGEKSNEVEEETPLLKSENVETEKQNSEFEDAELSNDIDAMNVAKTDSNADFGTENEIDSNSSSGSDEVRELVSELVDDTESVEEKLQVKNTALELAEEVEKKQASTGQDWEEGAAAQPMRLEGARKGSTVLGYFDVSADNAISRAIKSQAFRRDYGRPQVLAVHANYIALGMSNGVIIVVPSKYSAQQGDQMDLKMLMLGAQGDRSQIPVTSICFDQQGELLLAGYGDGHVTYWNLPRGTVAKVLTGEHKVAVVHTLFLGQDSQVKSQYKAVTGDCKGLLLLHEISVLKLFGLQIKTQCLLDGQQTGTVLCASPLLPDEIAEAASLPGNTTGSTSGLGGVMGGVVGGATGWKLFAEGSSSAEEGSSLSEEGVVIFATHQNALVVRLSPGLKVYANFKKPEGVREGAMPYTSWKCTTQSHSSSTENSSHEALEKISLLAIVWDRNVQVAKLVKSKLTFCGNWTLESAAIGLAWLDDQMLIILTMVGQLCLYARDGTLIHQTSYDVNGMGGDDMIAYHTYFTNVYGNPEKAFQNSLAVRGAAIYVLAPTHLVICRLLLWRERIQVLRDAGDWMGAFNMAMTLYDGQAHGVIDLPRSLHAIQETVAPYLVELLNSYVDEVFSYMAVAFSNHTVEEKEVDGAANDINSSYANIKEQYTRVGGVAVEFCVHIKRTDILFDEIFSKFVAVHQKDTFLELLEPYILKDMLGSLPPEIMQALVEHYNCKGWLQRVEQCVLHMDISSLDFNQVVRLCRDNGLYGALIYLFNKGLDDYKTPLEELLSVLKNHGRDAAAAGYRMLVYLKYCFSGLAFPPGHGTISMQRLPSLRSELVQFLLEDFGRPKSQPGASVSFSGAYLNLYYLLELDTEATLDVLRIAFVEDDNFENEESLLHSPDLDADDSTASDRILENKNIMVQKTVDGLVLVLDVDISHTVGSAGNKDTNMGVWPSKNDIGLLIEFIASYIATKRASVSKSVMSQILEYLMSENYVLLNSSEQMNESKKTREKKVLALLDAVPQSGWNAAFVLHLGEKAQFHQVCGFVHATRCDYLAVDSYMKDVDEPVHAFSFIDGMLLKLSEADSTAFRSAVISRIPELVTLSRECTFFLVSSYFNKESGRILSELQSNPRSLFLYLKTLFEVHLSGTLNFSSIYVEDVLDGPWAKPKKSEKSWLEAYLERVNEFPKFIRDNPVEVNDDMIELYLKMLCQYEPDLVLKFLETSESYRVDRCLQLCQEYGIVDATAFLLERVGDVGSALLLVLSGLNDKFTMLDTAVNSSIPNKDEDKHGHVDHLVTASRLNEVQDVERILHACIGLCQRNTPRLESEEAESLWFHLLDTFCKPLLISQGNSETGLFVQSSSFKKVSEADEITWRICESEGCAPLLKRLFSQFIKEIVEGMVGYVRLPSIMSKLLSDNGGQEFGDFKPTILGMLGTYSFEMRILDTAKCLIEDDTFYTMNVLKKGATKGYAPQSLLCCICNTSFSKSHSSSGIRMFSCGHAIHLQCEPQESGTSSQSSSHVCPVCVVKKRSHKGKGKAVEQGLVSTSSYRPWRTQVAAVMHSHDLDAFENLSSSHPISRFEMLNSLHNKKSATQTDTMPQLKLAPPAVYHDKVNKRNYFSGGASSDSTTEKQSKNRQLRDVKAKGSSSSARFPLKSRIFGKEKTRVQ